MPKMNPCKPTPSRETNMPVRCLAPLVALVLVGCAAAPPARTAADLTADVAATERAFAATMADRDLDAFAGFIAEEAVFFTDDEPLRGKDAVVGAWSALFRTEQAPFSWEPDRVEVLASGTLALSTGPVRDPDGQVIGRFTSVWRLGPDGWRIVFDQGNEVCGQ
jgi:ketosteroid isomerase-like protein